MIKYQIISKIKYQNSKLFNYLCLDTSTKAGLKFEFLKIGIYLKFVF